MDVFNDTETYDIYSMAETSTLFSKFGTSLSLFIGTTLNTYSINSKYLLTVIYISVSVWLDAKFSSKVPLAFHSSFHVLFVIFLLTISISSHEIAIFFSQFYTTTNLTHLWDSVQERYVSFNLNFIDKLIFASNRRLYSLPCQK